MDGLGSFLCKSPDGSWLTAASAAQALERIAVVLSAATGEAPRHSATTGSSSGIPDIQVDFWR